MTPFDKDWNQEPSELAAEPAPGSGDNRLSPEPTPPKRGPGNPGKKATQKEMGERIRVTAKLLVARVHKGEIKKALKAKYNVGFRVIEMYIARARSLLLSRSGRPKEIHISESIAFYESVIRDPEASLRDKMFAQARIDEVLGLAAPRETRLTGKDGGPLKVEHAEVHFFVPDNGRGDAGAPAEPVAAGASEQ